MEEEIERLRRRRHDASGARHRAALVVYLDRQEADFHAPGRAEQTMRRSWASRKGGSHENVRNSSDRRRASSNAFSLVSAADVRVRGRGVGLAGGDQLGAAGETP